MDRKLFGIFLVSKNSVSISVCVVVYDLYHITIRPHLTVLSWAVTIDVFIYDISKENTDLPLFMDHLKANRITVEDRSNCR